MTNTKLVNKQKYANHWVGVFFTWLFLSCYMGTLAAATLSTEDEGAWPGNEIFREEIEQLLGEPSIVLEQDDGGTFVVYRVQAAYQVSDSQSGQEPQSVAYLGLAGNVIRWRAAKEELLEVQVKYNDQNQLMSLHSVRRDSF